MLDEQIERAIDDAWARVRREILADRTSSIAASPAAEANPSPAQPAPGASPSALTTATSLRCIG